MWSLDFGEKELMEMSDMANDDCREWLLILLEFPGSAAKKTRAKECLIAPRRRRKRREILERNGMAAMKAILFPCHKKSVSKVSCECLCCWLNQSQTKSGRIVCV